MPPKVKLLLALSAALLLSACGGSGSGAGGSGGSGGSGGGTPTPAETGIASYGLQASDVPSGFVACPESGDVSTSSDSDVKGEWQYQQKQGAKAGYIKVWGATSGDCESIIVAGPGAQSGGTKKLIASVVLQFADSTGAQKGYQGAFGVNPGSIVKIGGGSGTALGLGPNSAYVYGAAAGEADWQKDVYMVGIVEQNLAEADLKKAIGDVNGKVP
jgi:hypothetical protein